MAVGEFKYEDDLLKHYVREEAWLPLCKKELTRIHSEAEKNPKANRRLRYFTFCAIGAIDVLMLDVAKVIRQSQNGKFDTVFFFNRDRESVIETQKRIPGSIGFVGDFIDVVLTVDPNEEYIVDGGDPLMAPANESDTIETRNHARRLAERQQFIKQFPFDVVNLDLEGHLFKPRERLPGKMIAALRKILDWQKRPLPNGRILDAFSLMFTTKIGPANLSDDYLAALRDCLTTNLTADERLRAPLVERGGSDDVTTLQRENFEVFFKLATPKILLHTIMEFDWYVDPGQGIRIIEFERPHEDGAYKMLHLGMSIRRHVPPREQRMSGEVSREAQDACQEVIRRLFFTKEEVITEDSIDKARLQKSLDQIRARRQKYYPDEEREPARG